MIMRAAESVYPDAEKYYLGTGEKSKRNIGFYSSLGYKISGKHQETEKVMLVIMEKEHQKEIKRQKLQEETYDSCH